jgi:hypothetical protein
MVKIGDKCGDLQVKTFYYFLVATTFKIHFPDDCCINFYFF